MRSKILDPFALSHTDTSNRRQLENPATGYLAENNPLGLPVKIAAIGELILKLGSERTGGGLASVLAMWAKIVNEELLMDIA